MNINSVLDIFGYLTFAIGILSLILLFSVVAAKKRTAINHNAVAKAKIDRYIVNFQRWILAPCFGILLVLSVHFTSQQIPSPSVALEPSISPTTSGQIIIVTATSPSSSIFPASVTQSPQSTQLIPTVTQSPQLSVPVETSSSSNTQGDIGLIYDDVSFTLLNLGSNTLSLEGIVFRSQSAEWNARDWGLGIYNKLPANKCLHLRDATVGQRSPPSICRNQILGLQEVGRRALFWIGVDSFEVIKNGEPFAICFVSYQTCTINI
jgi:hypothetical protein